MCEPIRKWQKPGDKYAIELSVYECPTNPIEAEEYVSTLILFHKRYRIGNETAINHTKFNSWKEVKVAIHKEYKDIVYCSPVYMLDHSGIILSTTPFDCQWDSGQIGFAIIRKSTLESWGRSVELTQDLIAELQNNVERYGRYLTGFVYCLYLMEYKTCETCGHASEDIVDSLGDVYDIVEVPKDAFGEKYAYIFEHEVK